ncbi:MAG: TonB family protein [Campylobacterales bacterium]|nr:TonB family protein [Campylobacterales bacterium]
MNRYLSSFFISSSIYFTAVATLFYFINSESCKAKNEMTNQKVVKISLLDLQKEEQPEVSKPKEEIRKEAITQIKSNSLTKIVPHPHAKSIQKVELKEKIKEEEQLVKKEEPTEKTTSKHAIQSSESSVENNVVAQEELEEKQKSFFLKLRELINKNKSYPESARRREIQGDIQVKFCILEDGNVNNIELLAGHSIFKNSAIEAVQKSFPVEVDKALFSFPKEFKITIAYILK